MARRISDGGVEECKDFSPPNGHTTSASSTRLPLGSWDSNTRAPNYVIATPQRLRRTESQRSSDLARKRARYAQQTEGQRLHDAHERRTQGGSFLQHLGGASPATAANAAAEETSRMATGARRARQLLANRESRRAAGQIAAQENARYKDSYLRAFDPARPMHLKSWVQQDMQKGFTDELQRLRPGRCHFCGERWFAAQTPARAAALAEGQYTCDRCKREKETVKSTAGLTFVCLSRAKGLVGLLIEPMTFERLAKIGDKPTLQLRLREEVRLRALAGETLHLHGGVA